MILVYMQRLRELRTLSPVGRGLKLQLSLFVLFALASCTSAEPTDHAGEIGSIRQALTSNASPGAPAETKLFEIPLPTDMSMGQVALGANRALQLGQRAEVSGSAGGPAAELVNTGSKSTVLEARARSSDITSVADVTLGRKASVTGDVRSAGKVKLLPKASVSGSIQENAAVSIEPFSWSVDFPALGHNVTVRAGQGQSALPGSYGKALVKASARLHLSAGTYFFDKVEVERGGSLVLDTSGGTLLVYVRSGVLVRGKMEVVGSIDRVLIGYAGTSPAVFEGALNGTFVAPAATVQLSHCGHPLPDPTADHRGAVFARSIELDQDVSFEFTPFAGWNTATLTVRTFLLDESAQNQQGAPAAAGVYVRVNGKAVGVTGADGTATVQVPPGELQVTALVPSFSRGEATITLAAGARGTVSIVLDDGKEVIEPSTLVLDEAPEGVLASSASGVTLRFQHEGTPVVLERVEQVELMDRNGTVVAPLDSQFTLAGEALVTTDIAAFRSAVQPLATGEIGIRVTGVDALGFTYSSSVNFRLGQFRLVGTLTPPPSNSALGVANIDVEVRLLGTPVAFNRTSDGSGHFEIESVPLGNIGFDSKTTAAGLDYYGQATLFLASDRGVTLVLRSVTDVINGVPPLTSSPLPGASFQAAAVVNLPSESIAARIQSNAARSLPLLAPAAALTAGPAVSLSVAAAQEGVSVSGTATLTVPQGTKTVSLKYNVFSAEYPVYVLQQSVFNDVWSLAVFAGAGGQQLFQTTRNVNSQLFAPPIWQSDGTTGDITQVLDVAALTTTGEATLTVAASSTNVGDSLLTTIVSATLSAEVALTINEVVPDVVAPTVGDSSYYSVPRPGATNHFERWFTLGITKPSEATITQVRAVLSGGADLMTLVEEGPGPNVVVVDEGHIRVRVSLHGTASTVNSTPPPTQQLTYRFRVQAELDSATIEDERDSAARQALWRMPDGLARYGARDVGLDDWSSLGCYDWLQQHSSLVTRIDDISGEHSRNIGHRGHERGVDIDQFHYYTFTGAASGGDNYSRLRSAVLAALSGDAAARGRVSDWVTATRTGLADLLELNDVSRLYYAIGSQAQQASAGVNLSLAAGWARSLIQTGSVTAAGGQVLNTGLGAWAEANNDRVTYNAVHNSHIHIALNAGLLAN